MTNKRATIGATITWVVATIIILTMVIMFLVVSTGLAGEREIKAFDPFVFTEGQSSSIDSEQMLLALLQTKINDETFKDLIMEGRYDELKEKLKPILNNFPDPSKGFGKWIFEVYEGPEGLNSKGYPPKPVLKVRGTAKKVKTYLSLPPYEFTRYSKIYLNDDLRVIFFIDCPIGDCR